MPQCLVEAAKFVWNNPSAALPMLMVGREAAKEYVSEHPELIDAAIFILSQGRGSGGKGLGNPFKGRTPAEIDRMFRGKGFEPRGPDPAGGKGGYINPKTGRSYHIDEANSFGEPPHVDVNRARGYKGYLPKKKYDIDP
jgi:hypothetical protein